MNRLKEIRKKSDISQEELAQKLNVAQNTISQWENNKRDIDSSKLSMLADYFNVSIDYLLERDEIETIAAHNDGPPLTEEEQHKLEEYAKFLLSQRLKEKD